MADDGGRVIAASVSNRTVRHHKSQSRSTYYKPEVRYLYEVGGTEYEGSVIRFGDLESGSTKSAQEVVDRYAPGSAITVRYNPADPPQATLETMSAAGSQIIMGAVFIILPLFIMAVIGTIIASSGVTHY